MKKIFCCILISFAYIIYADNNDLLNDYKLLYTDLVNIRTWGYKSFYNSALNRTNGYINLSQGALQLTENNFDCAIMGEGFFKIRLNDGSAAYTRNGSFRVDSEGNLITQQGFPLYDNIRLMKSFLPETFKITRDHNIFVSYVEKNNKIVETQLGQILTYKIPSEYLEHYEGSLYKINKNSKYTEEITFDNSIHKEILEMSNYSLLPVILRMYYILSIIDDNIIPNINFKKELLNILIQKYSDNFILDRTIFSINDQLYIILRILEYNKLVEEDKTSAESVFGEHPMKIPRLPPFLRDRNKIIEMFWEERYSLLESYLPSIKYDY